MKPTNEQIRQFAREITETVRLVLGLTIEETVQPGWYKPQMLTKVQKDAIWAAELIVIKAFVHQFL